MTFRLAVNVNYFASTPDAVVERVAALDNAGVHSFWVPETFGRDAFSVLTTLVSHTSRAALATGIINAYSRTPAALAQHFGTLHELSGGRAIAGLGTSSAKVIEGFHGMPFQPSAARLREATEVLRGYLSGAKVEFHGRVFDVSGFSLRIQLPPQPLPIMHATLHPRSVRMSAELADGWLPIWIPIDRLGAEVNALREWRTSAGKTWDSFTVRAPGDVFVVEDHSKAEEVRQQRRERLAFFVARNGEFYYQQFHRHGLGEAAEKIRRSWAQSGAQAAAQMVSDDLLQRFDFVGDIGACRARIEEQERLGVNLHQVFVVGDNPDIAARTAERLMS